MVLPTAQIPELEREEERLTEAIAEMTHERDGLVNTPEEIDSYNAIISNLNVERNEVEERLAELYA